MYLNRIIWYDEAGSKFLLTCVNVGGFWISEDIILSFGRTFGPHSWNLFDIDILSNLSHL